MILDQKLSLVVIMIIIYWLMIAYGYSLKTSLSSYRSHVSAHSNYIVSLHKINRILCTQPKDYETVGTQ